MEQTNNTDKGNNAFQGFTVAELRTAFELVEDKTNWKNPIDKSLAGPLTVAERKLINAAVIFFAGCEAKFTDEGGLAGAIFTRVKAVGYYVAVGA